MSSSIVGKRDSFGKLLQCNSLRESLGTLLEEEEEEEYQGSSNDNTDLSPRPDNVSVTGDINSCQNLERVHAGEDTEEPVLSSGTRQRPSNLTLRPLSLTPETLTSIRAAETLPTPSLTPSPRITGLKTLTLTPSPAAQISRHQSLSVTSSPRPILSDRHQSVDDTRTAKRMSSISYKRHDTAEIQSQPSSYLPTPGATPTTAFPPLHTALPALPSSSATSLPDLDRPLSPTEQVFLFRSHTSLLCRISELESAIAAQSRGRGPLTLRSSSHERLDSFASSSTCSTEADSVSNEMLQLVSDLKAERDELVRDVDGWRIRVSDLEKQIGVLNRRVEAERRESWVVRERLGVVEVEKKRMKDDLDREKLETMRLEKAVANEEAAKRALTEERSVLMGVIAEERERRIVVENELEEVRREMEDLRICAQRTEANLHAMVTATKAPLRVHESFDSEMSSVTDVEEYIPLGMQAGKLNSVEEEDEDHDLPRDISDAGSEGVPAELTNFEEDDDMSDGEDYTSSFGTFSHALTRITHSKKGSMERGWSFTQAQSSRRAVNIKKPAEVDHFFQCLDALGSDDDDSSAFALDGLAAKQSWNGAMRQICDDDDDEDLPPFVIPAQPTWKEIEAAKLEVVVEEAEEEEYDRGQNLFAPSAPSPPNVTVKPVTLDLTPRSVLDATMRSPPPPSMIHPRGFAQTALPTPLKVSPPPSLIPRLSASPKSPPTPTRQSPNTHDSPTTPASYAMTPNTRIPMPSLKKNTTSKTTKTTPPPSYIPHPKTISRPLQLSSLHPLIA